MNPQPEPITNGLDDMMGSPSTREDREIARRRREAERKLAEHYEQSEHPEQFQQSKAESEAAEAKTSAKAGAGDAEAEAAADAAPDASRKKDSGDPDNESGKKPEKE